LSSTHVASDSSGSAAMTVWSINNKPTGNFSGWSTSTRGLSGLTGHMGHRISYRKKNPQNISIEDADLTKTGVVLTLKKDALVVPMVENQAIKSKLVMRCMDIQQATQKQDMVQAQDVSATITSMQLIMCPKTSLKKMDN
jgi:hypothetical protein